MKAIIFGCGYLGTEVARLLMRQGIEVFAFRRSPEALQELERLGVRPIQGDVSQEADFAKIKHPCDWAINVSATGGGDADAYRQVYKSGNENIVRWLKETGCKKFVYTSSSSVYGQNDGSWVTEESPAEPSVETGRILREAEEIVLAAGPAVPGIALRLTGIYGPGRGYYLKRFLAGEPLAVADAERYCNLIHLRDAASAVMASLELGKAGELYNISDGAPARLGDLFEWFARVTGRSNPGATASPAAPARKRGASNKRVAYAKAREQLGWNLEYPTCKEGFAEELKRLGIPRVDEAKSG
jgi:nucleoside-diphosphate-sugar epimerase